MAAHLGYRLGDGARRPLASVLNAGRKVVFSRTLTTASWTNTTITAGDTTEEVDNLKQGGDGHLVVWGGVRLWRSLMQLDLLDELRVSLFPYIAGEGTRQPILVAVDANASRRRTAQPALGSPVELRTITPATDRELADALLRIQRAAYAVEAALIGDDRIPQLYEESEDLQRAPLLWLGAFTGQAMVGAVAWTEDPAGVDISRLVVLPDAHQQGVGSALVRAVVQRAADRRTTVCTGSENMPARRLYERLGFSSAGTDEVIPGLWITRYVHPSRC